MPFKVRKTGSKFEVVGPYKDEKCHVYGTHDDEDDAETQKKALYANANESEKNEGVSDPDKIKVQDDPMTTPRTSQAEGIDDAKPDKAEYPAQLRPSCLKFPMNDKRIHERRILTFQDFLDRIAYRTHDGQSNDTTQRGHGQNLTGK